MKFDRWNSRKVLVAIGALPFAIGLLSLVSMISNLQDTKLVSLISVFVIFLVGFFLVSLAKSAEIDSQQLKVTWHLFFVLKKQTVFPLRDFSHIDVKTAVSEQGIGTGNTIHTRYYQIHVVAKDPDNKGYFLSEHVLLERHKDLTQCIELVKELSQKTFLEIKYTDRVLEDVKVDNAVLLSSMS